MLLFLFLSSTGPVLNRHQRDSRAAEPGEALPCFQVLPVPLSGDGRGEARLGQGTAAGRGRTRTWKTSTAIVAEKHNSGSSCVLFVRFSRSTRSWSWPSLCPASLRSSWQPRRPWGVTAKLLLPFPPPAHPPSSLKTQRANIKPSWSPAGLTYGRKTVALVSSLLPRLTDELCAFFPERPAALISWLAPHGRIAVLTNRIVGQEPPPNLWLTQQKPFSCSVSIAQKLIFQFRVFLIEPGVLQTF